jgi:hypothetical protein
MRYPNKHVQAVIDEATRMGWRLVKCGGHFGGELYDPESSRAGCIVRIHLTPQNPEQHAKRLRRQVQQCPHG